MNRKFIAIITALALVVTLLAPVGVQEASAASKNKVDRVVSVSSDTYIGKNYSGPNDRNVPNLIIENDDNQNWVNETFRLELPSSAEWGNVNVAGLTNATVSKLSARILEVTTTTVAPGNEVIVPLIVELDGADGEVKVTINSRGSRVSGGSYTFATVGSGDTVAHVGTKKTVVRGTNPAAEIVIDENRANVLKGEQIFRLRLPNNITWNKDMENDPTSYIKFPGGVTGTAKVSDNGRDLTVEFTAPANGFGSRESIIINPSIVVTRDARFGDIAVSISRTKGQVSSVSSLVIAAYQDDDVEITVEEVVEMLAGKEDKNGNDDNYRTAKITVKELTEGSLARGIKDRSKIIDFELPSWVKIATNSDIEVNVKKGGGDLTRIPANSKDKVFGKQSKFEIEVADVIKDDYTGKAEFELKIPLTIDGTKTGDIDLKVSGAGIGEQTVTIAKAIAPVTAEVNVKDVRIGVQGQEAPEIIIKENVAGALKEGETLLLSFVDGYGFRFDGATYEVIEGGDELEIDKDKSGRQDENKSLKIYIDKESVNEPATIKVSNIKLTVDRTAPEGPVRLDIKGKAVVENGYYDDFANRVARFDFAKVITPAPGETRGTSVFTIDSTTYTVIESGKEVERTMDVAPYIKDSRTFLPVFFVAQSLGVAEQNIVWEPHSKTVTIYKGDRIAQMQIGSKVLTVNGTAIQMDTAPEIKDGRTMLPIYYVGQALGASVEWDGDARTVTVNN